MRRAKAYSWLKIFELQRKMMAIYLEDGYTKKEAEELASDCPECAKDNVRELYSLSEY